MGSRVFLYTCVRRFSFLSLPSEGNPVFLTSFDIGAIAWYNISQIQYNNHFLENQVFSMRNGNGFPQHTNISVRNLKTGILMGFMLLCCAAECHRTHARSSRSWRTRPLRGSLCSLFLLQSTCRRGDCVRCTHLSIPSDYGASALWGYRFSSFKTHHEHAKSCPTSILQWTSRFCLKAKSFSILCCYVVQRVRKYLYLSVPLYSSTLQNWSENVQGATGMLGRAFTFFFRAPMPPVKSSGSL